MRKFKKEQYYVNSLHTSAPVGLELPKSKQPLNLKYGLNSYEEVKLNLFKERLIHFKGSVTDAAESLKINRNSYINVLGLAEIKKIRSSITEENKASFLETYNEHNGKIRIIANKLKISKQQVANLVVKYGIRTRKTKAKKSETQLRLFR